MTCLDKVKQVLPVRRRQVLSDDFLLEVIQTLIDYLNEVENALNSVREARLQNDEEEEGNVRAEESAEEQLHDHGQGNEDHQDDDHHDEEAHSDNRDNDADEDPEDYAENYQYAEFRSYNNEEEFADDYVYGEGDDSAELLGHGEDDSADNNDRNDQEEYGFLHDSGRQVTDLDDYEEASPESLEMVERWKYADETEIEEEEVEEFTHL